MKEFNKRFTKFYKKCHKWPGLIISFLLLYYSITGIFMNHRDVFSSIDVNRNLLPKSFNYTNWNNAALKGNLIINADSILVYGNIGVWLTDSTLINYRNFNSGFPKGIDNKKIFDIHYTSTNQLYAATLFGLYTYNKQKQAWHKLNTEDRNARFVAIESIGDTIFALTRSHLYKGADKGIYTELNKQQLHELPNYKNEVSLFKTTWQIHSGEILGLPGKLFVDLLGLITLVLSLTGIVYFLFPNWIKKRKRNKKSVTTLVKTNRWSLKWHNYLGRWTYIALLILFITGMFLRPPLLISIVSSKTKPIRYSHLDQPNPWHDKLRDFCYDTQEGIFILSTSEGTHYMFANEWLPRPFEVQPPVSVMGINTLEPFGNGAYLIASFSGLYLWHPSHPDIYNYTKSELYKGKSSGRPVGDHKITGVITNTDGSQYMIDYDKGALPLHHNKAFPPMPDKILKASPISLWNLSLEIHTGRIFQDVLGMFYILIVPLSGLISALVVLSGYLLWRKRFRKKNNNTRK
nr:PepSY-associated TM helix domain-containing protein [Saccharicrinis aurantiacus]